MQNERVDWPITRRALLQRSGLGLGALGLAGLLAEQGKHGFRQIPSTANGAPARSALRGKGETRYPLLLNGGPSHVDTFDPKPPLARYAGRTVPQTLTTERKTGAAFPSPFAFRKYGESGIEVSELFAETARHIDDIAVIRSMYAQVPNHEPSLMLMNCGDSVLPRPSVGAWGTLRHELREPEPSRFHRHVSQGIPDQGRGKLAVGLFCLAFTRGTFIDSQYRVESTGSSKTLKAPTPRRRCSGGNWICFTALNS